MMDDENNEDNSLENNENKNQQSTRQRLKAVDPLLDCLDIICEQTQINFSEASALSGLPLVDGKLTPSLFVRAAEALGLGGNIVERRLKKIPRAVLPAVLILKGNDACVISRFIDKKTVEVTFANSGGEQVAMALDDIEKRYSGHAIFLKSNEAGFDKRAEQYHTIDPKSWFWGTIWRFKGTYSQVALAAFLVNVFTLATPLFIMNVYDRVVPNNATQTLWVLAIGVIIVLAFDLTLRILRGYLIDNAGNKIDVLLASYVFKHVLGMKLTGKPESAGAFASNLREFDTLRDFFTSATLVSLVDVPFIVLFVAIIGVLGGPLAWVPVVGAPIVVGLTFLFEAPMRRAIEEAKSGAIQKHAILTESISCLETIKSLSVEGRMQAKWERFVGQTAKAALKSRFFSALAVNFTVYVQQMATISVILWGVYLIADKQLSVGGLIAVVILTGRALAPLGQITNVLSRFEQSRIALGGLDEIMALPTERPVNKTFVHKDRLKGDIEFRGVTFSYPGQPMDALVGASFKIAAGERVGFLGRFGAGKSTVQRLLISLYEPSAGNVLIDGSEISQIDPADLRSNIGYASQDSTLFFGTVRENIVMQNPYIDDDRLMHAAEIAGVNRFVSIHPSGFDMRVGEGGGGVSGGQKQAISLARALLADVPILLMDEPTSSFDQRSENEFIAALPNYLEGKTLLLATHKASMLNLVDRLIIIEDGRIVADGPKEQVLQQLSQNKGEH